MKIVVRRFIVTFLFFALVAVFMKWSVDGCLALPEVDLVFTGGVKPPAVICETHKDMIGLPA